MHVPGWCWKYKPLDCNDIEIGIVQHIFIGIGIDFFPEFVGLRTPGRFLYVLAACLGVFLTSMVTIFIAQAIKQPLYNQARHDLLELQGPVSSMDRRK